jgi:hypothetical protein
MVGIIVCGHTEDEMMDNLITVLKTLNENNLKIKLTKNEFFQTDVKILGQIFSAVG